MAFRIESPASKVASIILVHFRTNNFSFWSISDETQTSFGEFPWMALILNKEKPENIACGASLITPYLVLTAAHCVKYAIRAIFIFISLWFDSNCFLLRRNLSKHDILVRVGEYNTLVSSDDEPAPHQDRHVVDMDIHPQFNPTIAFNDIALLVVDKPFTYAPNVAPICLPLFDSQFSPTETEIYDFKRCVATGWGKDAYGETTAFVCIKFWTIANWFAIQIARANSSTCYEK